MSRQHDFRRSMISIIKHNRDGSYRTQNDRRKSLLKMAADLYQAGFQLRNVQGIKQKHIRYLVQQWLAKGDSIGAIKNRMSHWRWLMEKIGKPKLIPSNDTLGIPKRCYSTGEDKSRELTQADLAAINDPLMQQSLLAQKLFGLRLEESLKIQPHVADQGDTLFIKGSWAKGGRDRNIPLRTAEQRAWLDSAKRLVQQKTHSLIPANIRYKTYRSRFEKRCQRAGIKHLHGLRHHYAQQRFLESTGFACPAKGGPKQADLTNKQKKRDHMARQQISEALGHSRQSITKIYCGS